MEKTPKIGHLHNAEESRDAIHIAIAPVVAAERLAPGQQIGFVEDDNTEKVGVGSNNPIGIVDPYLTGSIFEGDRFWLFLFPLAITGLRHDWTHPAFDNQGDPISEAKKWIEEFAAEWDVSFDKLMGVARNYDETGRHEILGYDLPDENWEKWKEFWPKYALITGRTTETTDDCPFSCVC